MILSMNKIDRKQSLWLFAGLAALLTAELAAARMRFGATGNFSVSVYSLSILAVVTFLGISMKKNGDAAWENIYLVMGLGLGLIFLVLIPFYVAPDEPIHFYTAYDLSNKMMGIHDKTGYLSIRRCDFSIPVVTNYKNAADYNRYWSYFSMPSGDTSLIRFEIDLSLGNPLSMPIMYLPAALAITVCRLLHTNAMTLILTGRLVNMLGYVIIVYFGIRRVPFGKFLMMALALMPMSLQQASSYSYDWLLNAAAFFAVAEMLYVLMLAKDGENVRVRDWILLCVSCGFLFFCKGKAYFPIALLPLFFWLHTFFSRHRAWRRVFWCAVFVLVAGVAAFVVWRTYFASGDFVEDPGSVLIRRGGCRGVTVQYCINHPAFVIRIFFATVKLKTVFYFQSFAGRALGWLDLPVSQTLIVCYLMILLASVPLPDSHVVSLDIAERGVICVAAALSFFLIHFGMLTTWTPAGKPLIEGVQGRYFIPLAFPLLISCKLTDYSVPRALERVTFWLLVLTLHAIVLYMTLHIRYTL